MSGVCYIANTSLPIECIIRYNQASVVDISSLMQAPDTLGEATCSTLCWPQYVCLLHGRNEFCDTGGTNVTEIQLPLGLGRTAQWHQSCILVRQYLRLNHNEWVWRKSHACVVQNCAFRGLETTRQGPVESRIIPIWLTWPTYGHPLKAEHRCYRCSVPQKRSKYALVLLSVHESMVNSQLTLQN